MAETTHKKLQCVIVAPETTVLDQMVDFVAVPLYDGEMGILPGRAPVVARLGYGELRTRVGQTETRYYVDGGFLQVAKDVVSVLTPRAIPAAGIDRSAARQALDRANAEVPTTPGGFESKIISISRARGQLQVADRAGKTA
jgi:F-type H+-transporting ATPase subunit epsilon